MTDKPCPANTVELLRAAIGTRYMNHDDLMRRAADLISMLQDRVAEMGHENRRALDRLGAVHAKCQHEISLVSERGPLTAFEEGRMDFAYVIRRMTLQESAVEGNVPTCEHEWVSADNEVVSGASICLKCKQIVATSDIADEGNRLVSDGPIYKCPYCNIRYRGLHECSQEPAEAGQCQARDCELSAGHDGPHATDENLRFEEPAATGPLTDKMTTAVNEGCRKLMGSLDDNYTMVTIPPGFYSNLPHKETDAERQGPSCTSCGYDAPEHAPDCYFVVENLCSKESGGR